MAQQMSLLKPSSYFQTAIADPSKKMTALPRPTYLSGTPSSPTPPPPSGTLKITVGTDPFQRTWHLPKALLARHSTHLAKLCSNPYRKEVLLPDIDARAFANFVDYIHSSIYSLNDKVPDFRRLRASTEAAVLGSNLGAKDYADAAIRQLHASFEPLARLRTSNAKRSLIRASDIEYVCRSDVDGVRRLFFDGVASHWMQREVLNMVNEMDFKGDTVTWAQVYDEYEEFRTRMRETLGIVDMSRSALLRPVAEYLVRLPVPDEVIRGEEDGGMEEGKGGRERGRLMLRPMSRFSGLMRTKSRPRGRAATEELDTDAMRAWAADVTSGLSRGGEVAVEGVDDGWEAMEETT